MENLQISDPNSDYQNKDQQAIKNNTGLSLFGNTPKRKIFNIIIVVVIIGIVVYCSGIFDRMFSKYDFYSDKDLQVYVVFVPDGMDDIQIDKETRLFMKYDREKLPNIYLDKIFVMNSSKKSNLMKLYDGDHKGAEIKVYVGKNAIGYISSNGEFIRVNF